MPDAFKVPIQSYTVSVHADGIRKSCPALILGHGAGNDMDSPLLVAVQQRLTGQGIRCVRYNFPYTEQGRRAPDPAARMQETVVAVADEVRRRYKPSALFLGGKSMGGRMASMVVADGYPATGLVFLGYPLHPPGKEDQPRTEHLSRIACPMLFVSGTRDRLARQDLLQAAVDALRTRATLYWVRDGDHSLDVPRSSGRSRDEVLDAVAQSIASWILQKRG